MILRKSWARAIGSKGVKCVSVKVVIRSQVQGHRVPVCVQRVYASGVDMVDIGSQRQGSRFSEFQSVFVRGGPRVI